VADRVEQVLAGDLGGEAEQVDRDDLLEQPRAVAVLNPDRPPASTSTRSPSPTSPNTSPTPR
jgi:hypothetical protein